MNFGRVVRVFFTITGIMLGSVLTIGVITSIFYEKEVKQMLVSEINKGLNTKIHVGEFNFSVIRHFPFASFDLKNVVIDEVSDEPVKDTLLYSKRISLLFNVMEIFSRDISVKKILVTDGFADIRIDTTGKGNYRFWKTSGDTTSSTIDLQKVSLSNVYVSYADKRTDEHYGLMSRTAKVALRISGDDVLLNTTGDLFVDRIIVGKRNYVDHKSVSVNTLLSINAAKGTYNIENGKVDIDGVPFDVSGKIFDKADAFIIDLAVASTTTDAQKIIAVIPEELIAPVKKYRGRGQFSFRSHISGNINKRKNPDVTVEFTFKDGSIENDQAAFEQINLTGTYSYSGRAKKAVLNIPSVTASLSGHKIQARVRLEDIPDAFLTLDAKTQLDLKEIRSFIKSDTLESLSGNLAMNVHYAGKVRELSNVGKGQLYNIQASGDVDISNVNFRLKNNPLVFSGMTGNFALHDNDVYIKNFTGKISSTDFNVDGVFRNFISFLLIPGQPGELQAKFNSSLVDLDELLVNKSTATSGDTSYLMKFNPRLVCNLDVGIGKIAFRRFTASGIHGRVKLERQVFTGDGLQFASMGGHVTMDGTINASRRDSLTMNYDAEFTKVDITRLFYEMENFDQETMTDKNVKGTLTADVRFTSAWSKDLTLNSKSVKSTANVVIENGELNNFQPIHALGKYIHVSDLDHIHFSTLKNNISISDRKIYIPHMDINSSAMNISGSGTHDFDNMVDYHIVMLLSDVLGKKVKSNITEFGEIEDDGLGNTKLFLSMKGPVMDPDFAYDGKAAGQKLRNDIAQEKQNLKSILNKEFGIYKNQPSVQAPKPKKHEEMQIDWSAE